VYDVLSAPLVLVRPIVLPSASARSVAGPAESIREKYSSILSPVSRLAVAFGGDAPSSSCTGFD
jgi:hypothetical protein